MRMFSPNTSSIFPSGSANPTFQPFNDFQCLLKYSVKPSKWKSRKYVLCTSIQRNMKSYIHTINWYDFCVSLLFSPIVVLLFPVKNGKAMVVNDCCWLLAFVLLKQIQNLQCILYWKIECWTMVHAWNTEWFLFGIAINFIYLIAFKTVSYLKNSRSQIYMFTINNQKHE